VKTNSSAINLFSVNRFFRRERLVEKPFKVYWCPTVSVEVFVFSSHFHNKQKNNRLIIRNYFFWSSNHTEGALTGSYFLRQELLCLSLR